MLIQECEVDHVCLTQPHRSHGDAILQLEPRLCLSSAAASTGALSAHDLHVRHLAHLKHLSAVTASADVTAVGDSLTPHERHLRHLRQLASASDVSGGDTLSAHFAGHLTPNADGSLSGTLPCVITGGTGRFAGATGSYAFSITAVPLADGSGFASTATMAGVISSVDSLK